MCVYVRVTTCLLPYILWMESQEDHVRLSPAHTSLGSFLPPATIILRAKEFADGKLYSITQGEHNGT